MAGKSLERKIFSYLIATQLRWGTTFGVSVQLVTVGMMGFLGQARLSES